MRTQKNRHTKTVLLSTQTHVKFDGKEIIIILRSKEPSQWDGSFQHPKHMFKLIGKKTLIKSINISNENIRTTEGIILTNQFQIYSFISVQNDKQKKIIVFNILI